MVVPSLKHKVVLRKNKKKSGRKEQKKKMKKKNWKKEGKKSWRGSVSHAFFEEELERLERRRSHDEDE